MSAHLHEPLRVHIGYMTSRRLEVSEPPTPKEGKMPKARTASLRVAHQRGCANEGSTVRAYEATFGYARPIIGGLELDEIGQPELRLIVRKIRERKQGGSDATVHKHLRHLRATLSAAVEEGYATSNPLTRKFINDL